MTNPVLPESFRALRMVKDDAGVRPEFQVLPTSALPEADTLIRVHFSSLNYKDGLAVGGRPGILKTYPMTPGIDLVGEVLTCATAAFKPGDIVIATGWGLGERHDGGFAELARVNAEHLVPLPAGRTTEWAMSVGTAGLTAMLALMALEDHGVKPDQGEVLVTGAAGGVGSTAVSLLATAGFNVTASTGRPDEAEYLRHLGAGQIIHRDELTALKRPLEKERWAGVIDNVGSTTLAAALASTRTHGTVAACGNAGGVDLPATVFPFILRGVTLAGIDSNTCPSARRKLAWQRLSADLPEGKLDTVTHVHALDDVPDLAQQILAGHVRGRTVIRVKD
ncbi:MDR family oxidoreductase [Deinococcus fonticola]|uniref:MDR family oxidoreductase n=1 Tax=Deinococcus fonticola TaxID=2528713 RepID=UPI00107501C2|nr:MDR family oxidoreductase [Deinococcus fonticola]